MPVAYSVHLKKDYGNIKLLLEKLWRLSTGYLWRLLRCSDFSWVCNVVIQSIPASFFFGIAQSLTSTTCRKYGLKGNS